MQFKYQMKRQNAADARATQTFNMAVKDRQVKYDLGAMNAYNAGDAAKGDMLTAAGRLNGRPQQSTQTSRFDEGAFQKWYAGKASLTGINPNPDDPAHKYDYRKAYTAGIEPKIDPGDGKYHWSSEFKADDHPNRYVNGMDTKYNVPAARSPRIDTLGAAGVQAKMPMRIGGTARTYDDTGKEYVSAGGMNYPVTTKKDEFGTDVRSVDTSRIIPTEQEYDFKAGVKKTASETLSLITPVTSTLSSRLREDIPDTMIPTVLNEVIENARDAVGRKTIEGYEEALLREEKLPIPDSVNRQIVNESIKAIEDSGMTEAQKDIAYDKIDSLGETNPRSIIDREAGRFLKKTGIIREITDFFGPRFPASEIDAKSKDDAMRTYATLKEKGYFKENGEVDEDKLDNMVTNLMASTENPDAIVEAAVGPEGVIRYDGERMSPEEARNSAQAIYLIKEQIRLKLDAIKAVDKSDGFIGPAIGGTYRIGKKVIKPLIEHDIKQQKAGRRSLPGTMGMGYLR
jgi:hypothetical protein